ncbi:MAG: hypothetical protein JXR46_11220 [Calditrichaceae bacterium]|nr:hypothetical protein [Calditrichaceae bacterium]MBN2709604.1 hypothetical protein [Calditrichaceae bacterium]RQV92401.1 MAG: hypothetical protein EH224_15485 [Calditrichota bacterium]
MQELEILSEKDQAYLINALQKSCRMILPVSDQKFGALSFHIYSFDERSTEGENVFQIRWGIRKLFQDKNIGKIDSQTLLKNLAHIIDKNFETIKKELNEYCLEQLQTYIAMEVEPVLSTNFGGLYDIKIGFCRSRKRAEEIKSSGWANFCIYISWTDEFGEFQEFLYPITFTGDQSSFDIPVDHIIKEFRRYRDSLL